MCIRKFWFEFSEDSDAPLPLGVKLGCGISAYNYDDALGIVKRLVFEGKSLPPLARKVKDVDISILDKNHVLPNMGDVLQRGVWFPLGYDEPE